MAIRKPTKQTLLYRKHIQLQSDYQNLSKKYRKVVMQKLELERELDSIIDRGQLEKIKSELAYYKSKLTKQELLKLYLNSKD